MKIEQTVLSEDLVAWKKDAESFGSSLNDAAWALVEAWPEKMSGHTFNNLKTALRAAILKYADEVAKAAKQPDRVAELETERMRLAACGAAALGYFDGCKDEYRSASLDDVLQLRSKYDEARAEVARLQKFEDEMTAARQVLKNNEATQRELVTLRVECERLRKDAERLDWLESQREAYGFQDIHEGNRWNVEGPFATLRQLIDAALAAKGE